MKKTILVGLSALFTFAALADVPSRPFPEKKGGGHGVGGGGDASERRVDEIRADILKWIAEGGSEDLKMREGITHEDYVSEMEKVLQAQEVIVTFVEKDDAQDKELQVSVEGKPKTCRGFVSERDQRMKMVCNIGRFKGASESEQYRLIHHEYAGLAGLETNEGAASDYFFSSQITDYLEPVKVLRLAVKKSRSADAQVSPGCRLYIDERRSFRPRATPNEINGYRIVRRKANADFVLSFRVQIEIGHLNRTILTSYLDHRGGFRIQAGAVYVSPNEMPSAVIRDPRNLEIEARMAQAKSVQEYESLKRQLNPALDSVRPQRSFSDFVLPTLPPCQSVIRGMSAK